MTPLAQAGFTLPWTLGTQNGSPQEFGNEVGGGNPPPGSATALDDDYYFAGTYPAPINTVAANEAITNLQRAVSSGHTTNRIHFNLSAAQATSTLRIRLATRALWGGWWNAAQNQAGPGFGTHELRFRINGGNIGTRTVTADTEFFIEADAGTGGVFNAVTGENILEITRTGGTQDGWIAFDYFTFEIHPTALADGDGDGLQRWWEEEQGLDDALASDAGQDTDGDGLTNTSERANGTRAHDADTDDDGLLDGVETGTGVYTSAMNTGTSPLSPDHDGDSLPDGAEVTASPSTNPLLTDTDGDGAADAWEVRTGYSANSNTSTPPAWSGAIGVQFVSDYDPAGALTSFEVTGLVPQQNWNRTKPLTSWNTPSGTTGDIAAPIAGTLVNSAGAGSGMTLSWTSQNTWFTGNRGGATQKLFSGFLNLYDAAHAEITLSGIPFTTYDVLVYVGNSYENSPGCVRLNDNAGGDLYFSSASIAPQSEFIEPAASNAVRPWRGNVVRFRNVTGSSTNVKLVRVGDAIAGVHAIQIVNATQDTDGDTLPDWWELAHRLKPDFSTDATQDGDSDTLTNVQEFTRQTRPDLADTDGDGLSDAVETNTGAFVSTSNTGTNPRLTDTDGDSLSDMEEIVIKPTPTNPNLADTDGDGRSDAEEIARRTDPNSSTAANAHMPVVSALPHTLNWTLDLQVVWDHERGNMSGGQWGDSYLFQIAINNAATATWQNAMSVGLRAKHESLCHFLYTGYDGGFSYSNTPTGDNWESDWNTTPADIKSALGFSGHGPCDISDRLRFEITASSSGAVNGWSVTYRILNLDTLPSPTVVHTSTFNNCTAAPQIHDGTVQWRDDSEPPNANRLIISTLQGVTLYFQTTPLENTAAFAAWKDTDEDGMPDGWEDANLFNKSSATDAALDTDSDGLSNVRECLAGTNPRQRDSDGDTIADGLEVSRGSDPLLATSRPGYYNGAPSGTSGADLNGNGLPDDWELWAGSFALSSLGDADSDGQNNSQESIAGTDPFDPASRLWAQSERSGNNLLLSWPHLPNKLHQAWESTDLSNWSISGGVPAVIGETYRQTFTNALNGAVPRKFYQARVSDLDADLDGVSDWAEVNVLGSSATNANSLRSSMPVDADGDSITDGTMHGDYAAYIERFQGAGAAGGFPNGGAGLGGTTGGGISKAQAARFLTQATFGPIPADIDRVQQLGYNAWLDEQIAKPATLHSTYAQAISADYFGSRTNSDSYNGSDTDNFLFGNNLMTAFARAAIQGEDQLRQRVAFALSQICVTSRRDANIENRVLGMADFYDIFVRNAFGSYHDVLMQVTLHPCMGRYLSHIGNQKANPSINQYPDENYAREVMQLFSIGLWELNMDGTRKVNGSGQNIPTYSNAGITQLARVMTGLWFAGHEWGGGGWSEGDYATPMGMNADRHDFGEKTLLGGHIIPARTPTAENGLLDVSDAIRHLFEHENCAPFVCKQLIQFLVTDNPSPACVQRIASVFTNDGSGKRGNLGAVVKAILLDIEARDPRYADNDMSYGRLKEPVIRTMALARAFGLRDVPNLLWWDWGEYFGASRQEPTYSPSVFNFFRPDYRAPGAITQSQLSSPVFQITDSFSSIAFPNRIWTDIERGFDLWQVYRFPLDLSHETALAASPELLVDHLNLIFCAGKMSAATRGIILNTLNQLPASQPDARARIAAYLVNISPEGSVMR